jgi:hypothetical protein
VLEERRLHYLAALFVLAAQGMWSVEHLTPDHVNAAVVVYTVFALFYAGTSFRAELGNSVYLALSAHFFVLVFMMRTALAVPPWRFLGVLAILNAAIAAPALRSRAGGIAHIFALTGSQFILMVWQGVVWESPWPLTAIWCGTTVTAFAFVCLLRARQSRIETAPFRTASAISGLMGLFVITIAAALNERGGAPGVVTLAAASAGVIALVLATDALSAWPALAPMTTAVAAFMLLVRSAQQFSIERWYEEFLFAAGIYAVFVAYPFVLGLRAQRKLTPYLTAVMASGFFFLFARHTLLEAGFDDRIGLLPIGQAALMGSLLWNLLRLEPPGERMLGRLAMVAGAVLAFVTIAIPLQLEKEWITIGWALLAAALAWLIGRIPHRGLAFWIAGLLAAVFVRLALNPAVLTYHPRGSIPILNWYLYTYLVCAAAFFAAAYLMSRDSHDELMDGFPTISSMASTAGTIVLFLLVNIEIADFYSEGAALTFNFSSGLAQDLTYTIGWGLFAFALLSAGILLQRRAARIASIALLSVTVAKCFLHDLWRLGGLYRVGSFVGLAVCLTLVALLLQRYVLRPQHEAS